MTRKAKIICTLGPASRSRERILELARAGMDVARLNFSHGTQEDHGRTIELVREVEAELHKPLAIMQDLCGPKIRTGRLRGGRPVILKSGASLTLTDRDVPGSSARLHITYPGLSREVRTGDRILLADGLIELRVTGRASGEVACQIVNGGVLAEHQGVNLPGVKLRVPTLTEKDRDDLAFGLARGVDYVALSFVRRPADVILAKRLVAEAGHDTPVIAKIEKPEALGHLDEILQVTDGVLVARGDLGVEMELERVPVAQKNIIERAMAFRKPVITATQMLESMTAHPRPTRAEASDVANAIFDGTDAVMLSAETASGNYPVEAVRMMDRIVREAEAHPGADPLHRRRQIRNLSIAETICENTAHCSGALHLRAIAVFTRSGSSARYISKYRAAPPIYAFCHSKSVERRVALYWGVRPRGLPPGVPAPGDTDTLIAQAVHLLRVEKRVKAGDILAAVAGSPFGTAGGTNLLKLVRVGAK